MKKYLGTGIIIATLIGLLAAPVFAAVTFDPATGTGFVGKGDVQTPFGWNNAKLQQNAGNLVFSFDSTETYDVTVEWDTGNHNVTHHVIEVHRTSTVSANVLYDARTHKQVDGFVLRGYGAVTMTGGSIPNVGDEFGGPGHIVTNVELVSTTGGVLTVSNGSASAVLWLNSVGLKSKIVK